MRTHLVVVSVPVISHQIAISEFCKRLLQLHPTIRITFIIPVLESLPNASKSIIVSLSALDIETITLPPVNLPQEITVPALKLPLAMSLSLPSIHDALKSITSTSHVVAIVADYFAYELLPPLSFSPSLFSSIEESFQASYPRLILVVKLLLPWLIP